MLGEGQGLIEKTKKVWGAVKNLLYTEPLRSYLFSLMDFLDKVLSTLFPTNAYDVEDMNDKESWSSFTTIDDEEDLFLTINFNKNFYTTIDLEYLCIPGSLSYYLFHNNHHT
jgi:hypothetical protein